MSNETGGPAEETHSSVQRRRKVAIYGNLDEGINHTPKTASGSIETLARQSKANGQSNPQIELAKSSRENIFVFPACDTYKRNSHAGKEGTTVLLPPIAEISKSQLIIKRRGRDDPIPENSQNTEPSSGTHHDDDAHIATNTSGNTRLEDVNMIRQSSSSDTSDERKGNGEVCIIPLNNSTLSDSLFTGAANSPNYQMNRYIKHKEKHINVNSGWENKGRLSVPTTDKAQNKEQIPGIQWDFIGNTLGLTYVFLLLVVAVTYYWLNTILDNLTSQAEAFNIFLLVVQLLWLGVMIISVRLHRKKQVQNKNSHDVEIKDVGKLDADVNNKMKPDKQKTKSPFKFEPTDYGFGEDELSIYAKIGGTVLFMGYLLYTGLQIAEQSISYADTTYTDSGCTSATLTAMNCFLCLSIFYQIFFAFKFANLIINKWIAFSKFGIVHCIATSLCFCLYTVFEAINVTLAQNYISKGGTGRETQTAPPVRGNQTSYGVYARNLNVKNYRNCMESSDTKVFLLNLQPYFYPFCIQMNLFMVGFWIFLWQNIGKMDNATEPIQKEVDGDANVIGNPELETNQVIYVDCHASNRGLFSGLLLVSLVIVTVIVYFTLTESVDTIKEGTLIYGICQLCALSSMIFAVTLGLCDIRSLDVLKQMVSPVDDILLYVSLPFVFIFAFLNILPYTFHKNYLLMTGEILHLIQAILQTILITNGLRRCSNTDHNRNKKPGREPVTFLLVSNMALWLLMAFRTSNNPVHHEFYGEDVWTVAFYSTLPLALFYRFHSSICFADIWKRAYAAEMIPKEFAQTASIAFNNKY